MLNWTGEIKAGIKIAGRNFNNLRYADGNILSMENKKEIKSLLIGVKNDSENAGLKLNIQKTKIMASSSITSWQMGGKKGRSNDIFYFLGLQNHCGWCAPLKFKDTCSLEEKL